VDGGEREAALASRCRCRRLAMTTARGRSARDDGGAGSPTQQNYPDFRLPSFGSLSLD
jgi:hypothetical protein